MPLRPGTMRVGVGQAGGRRRALNPEGHDPLPGSVLGQVGHGGGQTSLDGAEAPAALGLGELGAGRDRPVDEHVHLEPVRCAGERRE